MPVSYTCVRVLNGHDGPVNAVKFNRTFDPAKSGVMSRAIQKKEHTACLLAQTSASYCGIHIKTCPGKNLGHQAFSLKSMQGNTDIQSMILPCMPLYWCLGCANSGATALMTTADLHHVEAISMFCCGMLPELWSFENFLAMSM